LGKENHGPSNRWAGDNKKIVPTRKTHDLKKRRADEDGSLVRRTPGGDLTLERGVIS